MAGEDEGLTPERLFEGAPKTLALYTAVADAVAAVGHAEVRVTKSQVAFRRQRGFAYVWRPGQYVRSEVPAVLSIVLPHRVGSTRFKEVVHPSAMVWMHHLELSDPADLDDEVRAWLAQAYENAG